MMFTQKGDGLRPDVDVPQKMSNAVLVHVISTTDGCDVIEMTAATILTGCPLM